jgi:phage tail-like protein
LPGIKKYGNVTLKKGIFKDDKALWDMYHLVVMNTFERKKVTINLLDEENKEAMNWELTNAFPCKMTVADMKSDANNAAVETMELAHEGLSLLID